MAGDVCTGARERKSGCCCFPGECWCWWSVLTASDGQQWLADFGGDYSNSARHNNGEAGEDRLFISPMLCITLYYSPTSRPSAAFR